MKTDYPHLGNYAAPEKLLKIYAYLSTEAAGSLDLEIPTQGNRDLIDLVGAKSASQLVPLFMQGAGCIVAAWKQADSEDLSQFPIVWIDSEGSPNAVFARNFEELLGMLHYYLGTLYDVISTAVRFAERPSLYDSPQEAFPVDQFAADAEEQWEEEEDEAAFHVWLETELGIPADRAAVQHIAEAYDAIPKFQDWVAGAK